MNANLDCEPQNEYVTKESAKIVDDHLHESENLHFLSEVQAILIDDSSQSITGTGYIAVTDRQVIGKKVSGFGNEVFSTSITYSNITSVDLREGYFITKLVINSKGEEYIFQNPSFADECGSDIANFVKSKIMKDKNGAESSRDPIDEIERLKELNEKGAISDEEFEDKKEDLLDEI